MADMAMGLAMVAFAGCGMDAIRTRRLVRYTRHGGMRFLRVGRLQVSWCMTRKPIR